MEIYLVRIVESLLLPPGIFLLLMLLGTFAVRRWYRSGTLMVLAGFFGLLAASLPITALGLRALLETTPPIDPALLERPRAGAIVVLGAGRRHGAEDYAALGKATQTLTPHGLERLRYAALLHQKTGLPILLAGGKPWGEAVSEAELMQAALTDSFGIQARWLDTQSHNTWQNAANSRQILQQAGIDHVILVTHAWHMPRALLAFHGNGLQVTPAPTGFTGQIDDGPLLPMFLPGGHALWQTSNALREWLGLAWYRIRYGAASPSP